MSRMMRRESSRDPDDRSGTPLGPLDAKRQSQSDSSATSPRRMRGSLAEPHRMQSRECWQNYDSSHSRARPEHDFSSSRFPVNAQIIPNEEGKRNRQDVRFEQSRNFDDDTILTVGHNPKSASNIDRHDSVSTHHPTRFSPPLCGPLGPQVQGRRPSRQQDYGTMHPHLERDPSKAQHNPPPASSGGGGHMAAPQPAHNGPPVALGNPAPQPAHNGPPVALGNPAPQLPYNGPPVAQDNPPAPNGQPPVPPNLAQADEASFDLRPFIYTTLCLPDERRAKWCKYRTIISLGIHVLMFALGITFTVMSVVALAEFNSSKALIPAKVLSALVGTLFTLVFLYWCLVFSWTFANGCHGPPCNFFFLSVIWALLFFFSTGLLFGLLIETIDRKKNIHEYFNKTCPGGDGKPEQCFDFVVVWALAAVLTYKLYYSTIFCVFVVRKCIRLYRRNALYNHYL